VIADLFKPVVVDANELALAAITEVGPGGHFFGAAHTLERYETAFYDPLVFERTNFEQWTEEGSQRTEERAEKVWRAALDSYVEPDLDEAIRDEMREFVDRRSSEGGAAPD